MSFGRSLQVFVPDIAEGVVEANALETVIEANGPVIFRCQLRQNLLGQQFEAFDSVL